MPFGPRGRPISRKAGKDENPACARSRLFACSSSSSACGCARDAKTSDDVPCLAWSEESAPPFSILSKVAKNTSAAADVHSVDTCCDADAKHFAIDVHAKALPNIRYFPPIEPWPNGLI